MSKTINVYTTINSPLKIVWNEVSKLENHTNWMHDAVKIDFLSENNRGLGAKMKVLTKVGPIRLYDYMTVTEWVEEESIGVDHIGIVKGKGRFKLEKIDDYSYSFFQHRHYLDGFLDALELGSKVILVVHDWGSALGFDWANRNRNRIAGVVYMEAIVRPVSWKEWPEASASIFNGFRSSAGEEMILKKNLFVEAVLPGSILRKLTEEEMEEYRRPFKEPEHRLPTLKWPREIPIDGEPEDVANIVSDYADWLAISDIPKLFINADPGAILIGEQREFCRTWPNQTEIKVSGSHFIQEDSTFEIGKAVSEWLQNLN